jgi:hypothetical protein
MLSLAPPVPAVILAITLAPALVESWRDPWLAGLSVAGFILVWLVSLVAIARLILREDVLEKVH